MTQNEINDLKGVWIDSCIPRDSDQVYHVIVHNAFYYPSLANKLEEPLLARANELGSDQFWDELITDETNRINDVLSDYGLCLVWENGDLLCEELEG